MKRKFLSLAMALVMCLGLFPLTAQAATLRQVDLPANCELIDVIGNMIWACNQEGRFGLIDSTGRIIVPFEHEYMEPYDLLEDGTVMLISITEAGEELYFFVDPTGKVTEFAMMTFYEKYGDVGVFSEGLVAVRDKETKKYGFADMTSALVIPCRYGRVESFSDGMAVVYNSADACYGYVDRTGNEVIPCQYNNAGSFVNGYAAVQIGKRWTLIDKTGKDLIPSQYTYSRSNTNTFSVRDFVAVQDSDGRLVLIDKTGREIVAPGRYERIGEVSEGLWAVSTSAWGDEWGFIDMSGNEVVPCRFREVSGFSEGLCAVRRDGMWGFIDKTGDEVILCQYSSVSDFNGGLAWVNSNGSYGLINTKGEVVAEPGLYQASTRVCREGFMAVSSDASGRTRWGFIDGSGKEIVPCKYSAVLDFSGGVAAVKNFDNQWGFVDASGQEIVPCQYKRVTASETEAGVYFVQSGNKTIILTTAPATGQPSAPTAYASTQTVLVDGRPVEFQAYALKDAEGNDTNYVKLRDVAYVLNGTSVQFNVGWNGAVNIVTGTAYQANGTEMSTPFSGNRTYAPASAPTNINGAAAGLDAIVLTDDAGNGYTYYKLRDLGAALGFTVDWSAEKGIFIETK